MRDAIPRWLSGHGAQGRVRARMPYGCVPFRWLCTRARAGLGCRLPDQGRGCCGGCVFYGCQPWMPRQSSVGIEGQILCSSLLNMANRTRVAWCPACFPTSECIYTFHPCPAPLLVTRGSFLKSPLTVPSGFGETRGAGQLAYPRESPKGCLLPVGPNYLPLPAGTRGFSVRFELGKRPGPAAGQ